MVFSREKPRTYRKTCSATAAYCVQSSFETLFLPKIYHIFRQKLATGRCGGVIGGAIVLQKLIHCLQLLIVLIENL